MFECDKIVTSVVNESRMDEGKNSRINSKEMKTFNKRFPSIISRSYQTATEKKESLKLIFEFFLRIPRPYSHPREKKGWFCYSSPRDAGVYRSGKGTTPFCEILLEKWGERVDGYVNYAHFQRS